MKCDSGAFALAMPRIENTRQMNGRPTDAPGTESTRQMNGRPTDARAPKALASCPMPGIENTRQMNGRPTDARGIRVLKTPGN